MCAYAIATTPVPALTLLLRMSQDLSESDEKQSHPFILLHMDESIGVPAAFANGELKWTNLMTAGRSNDATILAKARELMNAHTNGAPLEVRKALLGKLFESQYNAPAVIFFYKYFRAFVEEDEEHPVTLKSQAIAALVDANVPFIPWDVFVMFITEMYDTFADVDEEDLPPLNLKTAYLKCMADHPFNASNVTPKRTASVAARKATVKSWQDAFEKESQPGLSQSERDMLSDDVSVGRRAKVDEGAHTTASELQARRKALQAGIVRAELKLKHDKELLELNEELGKDGADHKSNKRHREYDELRDDDEQPNAGLLALDKFLKIMRTNIDLSRYIDFASMSKDRLDALKILGVNAASSKRLSSSTLLVTSATEADIKTLTHDFDAISSGFLFCYINLLSESSFTNAIERVKDRLAWWQWLIGFFGANKPAAVSFIQSFMMKHHKAPFWMPVTEERCSMMAIEAKDKCPLPIVVTNHGSSHQKSATKAQSPAKTMPGRGTLTTNGGVTFSANQTAKLVLWRARFPGYCQSRMTKEYTCSREKRGLSCKYKHECAWCHLPTCKASCSQAEKL